MRCLIAARLSTAVDFPMTSMQEWSIAPGKYSPCVCRSRQCSIARSWSMEVPGQAKYCGLIRSAVYCWSMECFMRFLNCAQKAPQTSSKLFQDLGSPVCKPNWRSFRTLSLPLRTVISTTEPRLTAPLPVVWVSRLGRRFSQQPEMHQSSASLKVAPAAR